MSRTSRPRNISTTDAIWEQVEAEAAETGQSKSSVVVSALAFYFQSKIVRSSWVVEDEDGWYDPNKFYTRSEDKHHHSSKLTLNISKTTMGNMQTLVAGGKIPQYRSVADVVRDAITHRVYTIGRKIDDGEVLADTTVSMLQAESDHFIAQAKDMEQLLASTREVLDIALGREDTISYAEGRLKMLWAQLSSIPEMFKKDFVAMLEEYGAKLAAVKENRVQPIVRSRGRLSGS